MCGIFLVYSKKKKKLDISRCKLATKDLFNRGYVAASSSVCVQALPHPDALVEVESVAILGQSQ